MYDSFSALPLFPVQTLFLFAKPTSSLLALLVELKGNLETETRLEQEKALPLPTGTMRYLPTFASVLIYPGVKLVNAFFYLLLHSWTSARHL